MSTLDPTVAPEAAFGPWNPGIQSALPEAFLPLATVFAAINTSGSLKETRDLRQVCGLPLERLSVLTPERLALHEVLIRVMADLTVPDGDKYADLGVNFRRMTAALMSAHVAPQVPAIRAAHADMMAHAARRLRAFATGAAAVPRKAGVSSRPWFARWFAATAEREPSIAPEDADTAELMRLRRAATDSDDPLDRACHDALATVGEALFAHNGRLPADCTLLMTIASRLVSNDHGSAIIGAMIDRGFIAAAVALGFRPLPVQAAPTVMNVKGASAAGKSTMRPLQKELATRLGVDWRDFALISPDIWRKYLLDYDSLGPARRYAGTLTGQEIEIVDKKLDRYMAAKAETGRMSHLLIDRFRFDSFSTDPDAEAGARLLTRFGRDIYMSFMITPPDATVERAWKRGEKFGRYKAVEDLLAHNVEAYVGIPHLFFTWALREGKRVHYEFIDNSVPENTRPRTVAYGVGDRLNVLDVTCLLDIDRYQRIDISAVTPEAVYPAGARAAADSPGTFLIDCLRQLARVDFANRDTGAIYARVEQGQRTYLSEDLARAAIPDHRVHSAFLRCLARVPAAAKQSPAPPPLSRTGAVTLGAWLGAVQHG
jgi:hypothetical protein